MNLTQTQTLPQAMVEKKPEKFDLDEITKLLATSQQLVSRVDRIQEHSDAFLEDFKNTVDEMGKAALQNNAK